MFRFALALVAALGLVAAPQAVKKTEEAVEKTAKTVAKDTVEGTKKVAKKVAKATETAAEKTVDGAKVVGKKTAHVAETAADKTVDGTKAVGKKTAKVAKTVATETADATKAGAKKVADAVEPKKKAAPKAAMPMGGKVNLNTATRAELIALPGIGEANADKIIKARPISSVDDLSSKKIVQNQYYEKFKDMVSVK